MKKYCTRCHTQMRYHSSHLLYYCDLCELYYTKFFTLSEIRKMKLQTLNIV